MKNHLKRITSPKTWKVDRKSSKFILRPNPGAHSYSAGLPLGIVVRDFLGLASTMREVKKMLHRREIIVDGKRRKDHSFVIGLFDILSIPEIKKNYRIILDRLGRLSVMEVALNEADKKLCKVVGKTALGKSKIQFNLHDGKNIIADNKAKIGDSFLIQLPNLEIKETFHLHPGSMVFLIKGKHAGETGVLKSLKGREAVYESNGKSIETPIDYLFVIGEKKSMLNITS